MEKKRLLTWAIVLSAFLSLLQINSASAVFLDIDVEKHVSVDDGTTWQDADYPPGPEAAGGSQTVWFQFVVTNTGNQPLDNITLSDSDFYLSCCTPPTSLEPDESFECIIGPFEAIIGQHTNTATATGKHGTTTCTDSDDANYIGLAIGVEKYVSVDDRDTWHDADNSPGPQVLGGNQTVWFRFSVTNVWNDILTNITLADSDFDAEINSQCTLPDELAPAESFECTIGPLDAIVGQHTNTATVTADSTKETYQDSDDANYLGLADPSITVAKYVSVDGQVTWGDADLPPGPEVLEETDVYFKFVVSNNGNVPLTNVTLEDTDFDVSECALTDPLGPGDSFECVIGPFSDLVGQHMNTGKATGDYDSAHYSDEDDAYVMITNIPSSIDVTKTANPTEVAEPGDTTEFTVLVQNTSIVDTVTITSLTDSVHGDLNGLGDCSVPQMLTPSEFYQCSFSADVPGSAGVEVTVSAQNTSDTDPVTITDLNDWINGDLNIQGDCPVPQTLAPGEFYQCSFSADVPTDDGGNATVDFAVVIQNTSNGDTITITSFHSLIGSDLNTLGDCSVPQTLEPGETYQCSFSTEVTGNAGWSETDVVTASGTDDDGYPVSGDDDATVIVTDVPSSISVTKTANPTEVAEPGDSVEFTVVIHNISMVDTVFIIGLNDSIHGNLNGRGDCFVPRILEPGESYQCSFSAEVVGNAGWNETDLVIASGIDDDLNPVSDDDDATVTVEDALPTITVEKTADPTSVDEPGGPVSFNVRVTNTSAEPVTLTSLSDDIYGDIAEASNPLINGTACSVPQTILDGGFYECSFNVDIYGNVGDSQTDIITATAGDDEGNEVTATDDATVTIECADADGDGYTTCGGDCDDTNADVNPGSDEVTCNGIDDDCDALTLDNPNSDGDDYGVCDDCDDSTPDVYPGAPELCDGLDNDCDGEVDEDCGPCVRLTKSIDGPYRNGAIPLFPPGDLLLDDAIIPVGVQSGPNGAFENLYYLLVEIRVQNCGSTDLTGVVVQDTFSDEAQPFATDDPVNVTIVPLPDPLNGLVQECLTWSVGAIPPGQNRTLEVKVGSEFDLSGRLEPTTAGQEIFYNGRDFGQASASVTTTEGPSASVGAMLISTTSPEIPCADSAGEWDLYLLQQDGPKLVPHDRCTSIDTLLPIVLEDDSTSMDSSRLTTYTYRVFLPVVQVGAGDQAAALDQMQLAGSETLDAPNRLLFGLMEVVYSLAARAAALVESLS